jgi:hypothetical protein
VKLHRSEKDRHRDIETKLTVHGRLVGYGFRGTKNGGKGSAEGDSPPAVSELCGSTLIMQLVDMDQVIGDAACGGACTGAKLKLPPLDRATATVQIVGNPARMIWQPIPAATSCHPPVVGQLHALDARSYKPARFIHPTSSQKPIMGLLIATPQS